MDYWDLLELEETLHMWLDAPGLEHEALWLGGDRRAGEAAWMPDAGWLLLYPDDEPLFP